MDLFVEKRAQLGIQSVNPFLFAIPNTPRSYIRGHAALRKLVDSFQLDQPKLIKATSLRKYLATTMQVSAYDL